MNRGRRQVWFAVTDGEPLAFFAGLWCWWTSVRKPADGEMTDDLYGFLATEANREIGAVHSKAIPVILTRQEDMDLWMTAPADEVIRLQRALADGALVRIAPPYSSRQSASL
ncbi:SOS response-associated peptidase family protein [Gluconobacter cerinus]|nr:SOS response-associated peptidase family protein [Gluconobacter cerinus]